MKKKIKINTSSLYIIIFYIKIIIIKKERTKALNGLVARTLLYCARPLPGNWLCLSALQNLHCLFLLCCYFFQSVISSLPHAQQVSPAQCLSRSMYWFTSFPPLKKKKKNWEKWFHFQHKKVRALLRTGVSLAESGRKRLWKEKRGEGKMGDEKEKQEKREKNIYVCVCCIRMAVWNQIKDHPSLSPPRSARRARVRACLSFFIIPPLIAQNNNARVPNKERTAYALLCSYIDERREGRRRLFQGFLCRLYQQSQIATWNIRV